MLKKLRTELPGKVLPPLPKKNKQSSTASNLLGVAMGRDDDDDDASLSSVSTMGTAALDKQVKNLSVKGKFSILWSCCLLLTLCRSPTQWIFDVFEWRNLDGRKISTGVRGRKNGSTNISRGKKFRSTHEIY